MSTVAELREQVIGWMEFPQTGGADDLDALIDAVRAEERERIAKSEEWWRGVYDCPMEPSQIMDELADFYMVSDHCSKVYVHFTGGRISKPNTWPSEVITVAEEIQSECINEAVAEAEESARAENEDRVQAAVSRAEHAERRADDLQSQLFAQNERHKRRLSAVPDLVAEVERLKKALDAYHRFNNIGNDLKSAQWTVGEWAKESDVSDEDLAYACKYLEDMA